MKTVCFTGRRPKDLYGYEHDKYIPLVNALKSNIRDLFQQGYDTFISGMAQGVDQLAFWAVNALKRDEHLPLRNIVFMPFKGQELRWSKIGLFSQQQYNTMLKHADEIKVLAKINGNNYSEVVKALHERNHAMVDQSDLVFGVYPTSDWKLERTKGGTAECLKYALSKNKQIIVLSNTTLQLL